MFHLRSALAVLVPAGAALLAAVMPVAAGANQTPNAALQRMLAGEAAALSVAGVELDAGGLRTVYRSRAFQPVWTDAARDRLLATLGAAAQEGLDPGAYNLNAINARQGSDAAKAAELDLLLTDAAIRYATHLRSGRVNPAEAEQDWQHATPAFDSAAFVTRLTKNGAESIDSLAPAYPGYERLRDALARYRELRKAGGWNTVSHGPTIKPGTEDERVPAIRRRLAVTGEYAGGEDGTVYDETLVAAVTAFQARHGLEADGAIGRGTINTMNVPVESRIRQIIANMERWRWLPRKLERNHIAVNVAAARLELIEDGEMVMATRVIVGKPTHKTLSFRASIGSVTLNPVWNVPASIASNEILPELKKNPGYLVANRLRIVNGFPAGSPQEEGIGIDWKRYTSFPYQLRQMSGPDNSLGRIKFNMPNGNDIYLHDTPARQLFAKARRTFSHGCVRVEEPLRLASMVLKQPELSPEKLQEMIDTGETNTIRLSKAIPVYLFYFTAWVDGEGVVQFRDDIYGYDKPLNGALDRAARAKAALLAKS